MKNGNRWTVVALGAMSVLAVLTACGTDKPSQEVTSVACISGSIVVTSFEELEREATAIVIGTGTGESRPMQEPDPGTNFGVAYQVEVERYLKGAGPDVLPIYQTEGCVVKVSGKQLRAPWVDALSPIRDGARYLFFLRPHPYLSDVMKRVAHPSRFVLDDGTASPDGPGPGPMTNFPAMRESDLIGTIEEILLAAPTSPN